MGGLSQDPRVSRQCQLPSQGSWEGALSAADGKQLSGPSKWHLRGFLCFLAVRGRASSLPSGSHMVLPFPNRKGLLELTGCHPLPLQLRRQCIYAKCGQGLQEQGSLHWKAPIWGLLFPVVYLGLQVKMLLDSWCHYPWVVRSLSGWINISIHPVLVIPAFHSSSPPLNSKHLSVCSGTCVGWRVCKLYCSGHLIRCPPGCLSAQPYACHLFTLGVFVSWLLITTPPQCWTPGLPPSPC